MGMENKFRKAPLREAKYLIKPTGASRNQKVIQLKRKVRMGIKFFFCPSPKRRGKIIGNINLL